MSLKEHAQRELELAGYHVVDAINEDDMNGMVYRNVMDLLDVFCKQGHSGFSAPFVLSIFKRVAGYELLTPLSGNDEEWNEVGGVDSPQWQNNRCGHVFKDADGRPYDCEGIIFKDPDDSCYTNRNSRVYITFPYTPTRKYVNVDNEGNVIEEPQVSAPGEQNANQ